MQIRRVVTADIDGRSTFVADEKLEAQTAELFAGLSFHTLWGDDATPTVPTDGTEPTHSRYYPGPPGYRFISITFPPAPGPGLPADLDPEAAAAEAEAKFPGLAGEHDEEGWHATDTVDVCLITKGQVTLVLQDGERVLGPGDVFVQNGTRHLWRPTSAEPCQMVGVIIGAHRTA